MDILLTLAIVYYVIPPINDENTLLKGVHKKNTNLKQMFIEALILKNMHTYDVLLKDFFPSNYFPFNRICACSTLNVLQFGTGAHELFLRPSRSHH